MTSWPILATMIFPALTIVAALKDVTSFTIPNWISIALAATFPPVALLCGLGVHDLLIALAVGMGGLVLGIGLFAAGWIGGGDAKLLAGCALWLGFPAVLSFLAISALIGGGLALSLLGLRSVWLRPLAAAGPAWVGRLATPGEAAPYGVALCLASLICFPQALIAQAAALY